MKKLIILVLISVLALGGISACTSLGTFSPAVQSVVDFVCAPSDAEKAEAAKWLTALDSIQAGVVAFYPPLAIAQASAVMTTLRDGGCFVLSKVQAALDLLNQMQTEQVKLLRVKTAPRTAAEQFPALTARIKGGK